MILSRAQSHVESTNIRSINSVISFAAGALFWRQSGRWCKLRLRAWRADVSHGNIHGDCIKYKPSDLQVYCNVLPNAASALDQLYVLPGYFPAQRNIVRRRNRIKRQKEGVMEWLCIVSMILNRYEGSHVLLMNATLPPPSLLHCTNFWTGLWIIW